MKRRKAREHILQILYQLENQFGMENLANAPTQEIAETFLNHFQKNRENIDEAHLKRLLKAVVENFGAIDSEIEKYSDHWKLNDMTRVDRNILRMAVAEFLYTDDISYSVSMDEAIEIAKRFGSDESPAFINGILDMIRKKLPNNPNKTAH